MNLKMTWNKIKQHQTSTSWHKDKKKVMKSSWTQSIGYIYQLYFIEPLLSRDTDCRRTGAPHKSCRFGGALTLPSYRHKLSEITQILPTYFRALITWGQNVRRLTNTSYPLTGASQVDATCQTCPYSWIFNVLTAFSQSILILVQQTAERVSSLCCIDCDRKSSMWLST